LQIVFYLLNKIGSVIFAASAIGAGLLVLRVIIAWAGSNPFLWLPYQLRRITEPVVRPFRQPFSGYQSRYERFDLLPLVAAVMVLLTGWFIADIIWRVTAISADLVGAATYGAFSGGLRAGRSILLVGLILLAGTLYEAAIFMRFLLPWFGIGYSSGLMRFLFKITEPLLRPLRRFLGRYVSVSLFDFTPLLALIAVRLVTQLLAGLVG
jgi:YggT family protein